MNPQTSSKRLAILYDISKSIPEGLGNEFPNAVENANLALKILISQGGELDGNLWKISTGPTYPDCVFDKIVLVEMGKPNATEPFFAMQEFDANNLINALPKSYGDFKGEYTYIDLAKAVGASAIDEGSSEIYVLIVSDMQESKMTRPYSDEWANFTQANFDDKYKVQWNLITARWERNPDFQVKLLKFERR